MKKSELWIWNFIYFFLILSIFFYSCNKKQEQTDTLLNKPEQNNSTMYTYRQQEEYTDLHSAEIPKVAIYDNEEILQIINMDLDIDPDDEQILILKVIDDVNTSIKIAVIDFDHVMEKNLRSWEYLTNSTNQRAFNLEFDDIIGDYNIEIIFTGTNKNSETTFYAFKKIPSPSNLGLFFTPICQLISDGTIQIQKSTRAASYQLRQKTGKSYPIIVERRDIDSSNSMDLIQEIYDWNYFKGQYELVTSKPVPANIVEENRLKTLFYSKNLEDFEIYLNGPWYNKKDIKTLIVFTPENDQLTFYSEDIQEIYNWDYLKKTVYNGLMFIITNPTSSAFRKKLNVTINSFDTINLSIGDINWDGTYMRVNEELMESLLQKDYSIVKPSEIKLTGYYEDENEEIKIIFEPPRFTMIIDNEAITEGGYSITGNIPILNNFYLKRKLRKIPKQFLKEEFENDILSDVSTYTAKNVLKKFYTLDKEKQIYLLQTEDLKNSDESDIWNILLSIHYKGYQDYHIFVLTLNILSENSLSSRIENYILEYAEVHEESKTIKTIVLTAGELGVKGIEAVTDESLTLLQVEYLEN